MLKFIYSAKAKRFCEISTILLTGTTQDKSKVEILPNFVAFSEYMNFTKSIFCTFKTDIAWSVGRMSPLDFGSALPRITRPLPPPDFKTLRHACDVIQFLNFTQFDPVVMIFFHFTIGFKLKSSDEMYREYLTFSFDCIALANSKVPLFPSLLPLNFIK